MTPRLAPAARGLHPSTSLSDVSTFYGIRWLYWVITGTETAQVELRSWDVGSGFGRTRWRVGLGRIRADSEQPRRGFCFAVLYGLYGHFDPTEMGSGFGRIR